MDSPVISSHQWVVGHKDRTRYMHYAPNFRSDGWTQSRVFYRWASFGTELASVFNVQRSPLGAKHSSLQWEKGQCGNNPNNPQSKIIEENDIRVPLFWTVLHHMKLHCPEGAAIKWLSLVVGHIFVPALGSTHLQNADVENKFTLHCPHRRWTAPRA